MYMIASRGTSIKQLFVCAPTEVDFARRGHAAGLRPTPLGDGVRAARAAGGRRAGARERQCWAVVYL